MVGRRLGMDGTYSLGWMENENVEQQQQPPEKEKRDHLAEELRKLNWLVILDDASSAAGCAWLLSINNGGCGRRSG